MGRKSSGRKLRREAARRSKGKALVTKPRELQPALSLDSLLDDAFNELTDFEEDEIDVLIQEFEAYSKEGVKTHDFESFLESAKSKVSPNVFALFMAFVLKALHETDEP